MTTLQAGLVWLLLLALIVVEFALAFVPAARAAVPFIGIAAAAVVALTFMRLGSSRGLTPIFAIAGVFWLCVLFGLGTLDPFTRHDVPAPTLTESSTLATPAR